MDPVSALVCVLLTVGCPAPPPASAFPAAQADTTTFVPNKPAAPAHVKLDIRGPGGGLTPKQLPKSFAFSFQQGFLFDPHAVADTCPAAQVKNSSCPATSKIGSGAIDVLVYGPGFPAAGEKHTATLRFYRAAAQRSGDIAGVAFYFRETDSGFEGTSVGRLIPTNGAVFGTEMRFDKLPLPQIPPVLQFTLTRMTIDFGVTPTATTTAAKARAAATRRPKRCASKKYARSHPRTCRKKKPKPKPTGLSLIKTPPSCSGAWLLQYAIGYTGHTEAREADAPCTRA